MKPTLTPRPPGQTAEERAAERQRRQRIGIFRSLAMLVALVGLAIWMTRGPGGLEVLSLQTASDLADDFSPIGPTTTYAPGDTFYLSADLRGYRPGMDVRARWLYGEQVITETPLIVQNSGDGYAGFALSPEDPPEWPQGAYRVELMYEDQVVDTTQFEVRPGG